MKIQQSKAESGKRKVKKQERLLSPHAFVGFTLIELLVVIAITGIMVVIGTNIFISVLRSANKATVLTQIQENGSSALGRISRIITNASAIEDPAGGGTQNYIIVQNKVLDTSQQLFTRISFVPSASGNGYIDIQSGAKPSDLTGNNFTASNPVTNNNQAGNAVDLVPNPAPYFQVIEPTGTSTTVVVVSFSLQQSKFQSATQTRQENTGSLPFLSSFTLRTY